MGVLEKVERKVDEMSKHASVYAEVSGRSMEAARFKIVAERIALLELGESYPIEIESGATAVVKAQPTEPQPIVADEPAPPTQWQFRSFVANLTNSGNLTDDQKIVLAWLKFKADGGLNG